MWKAFGYALRGAGTTCLVCLVCSRTAKKPLVHARVCTSQQPGGRTRAVDRAGTCGDVAGVRPGDSEAARGCLHIPAATHARRTIYQLWI